MLFRSGDYGRWLDPKTPKADLEQLLKSSPAEDLVTYPVSPMVNSPKNDDARCLEELKGAQGSLF